jgi:hypothetical protein
MFQKRHLFIVINPYSGTMKFRYPILILTLMVLAYSCGAGCTGKTDNYGGTPKPALPDVTPRVSPPPVSPAGIPSSDFLPGKDFFVVPSV